MDPKERLIRGSGNTRKGDFMNRRRTAARFALLFGVISTHILGGCGTSYTGTITPNPPSAPNPNFTPVGNMTTVRAEQISVLLPNGKVLIAGGLAAGFGQVPYLATAELYDPVTGTFSPTGNMTTARGYPTAVLLNNGKVLVVGGGAQVLNAELYDPLDGVFTAAASMISGAVNNGIGIPLTLLPNGTVLVSSVPSQIYDPGTGMFSATLAYPDPNPLWITTTLLLNGKVLLNGCAPACGPAASEIYDPTTDAFTTTGTPKNSNFYTATLLTNGKVLFVGSDPEVANPAQAELYDPAAGTFTSLGNTALATPADFAADVRLPNGTVIITGGQLEGGSGSTGAELYDPMSGNFTSAGTMNVGRHSHTATMLPDGTVLIAGGYSGWPEATSSAEIYKPTAP